MVGFHRFRRLDVRIAFRFMGNLQVLIELFNGCVFASFCRFQTASRARAE
jgi:hypothetical protein